MSLRLLLAAILVMLNGCATQPSGCDGVSRICLPMEQLTESRYQDSPDVTPNCLTDFAPDVPENACVTMEGAEGRPEHVLHNRFVTSLERYAQSVDARKQAACTIGILQSCEIAELMSDHGCQFRRNEMYYVLSGKIVELDGADAEQIFPQDYDPIVRSHFVVALLEGMRYLSGEECAKE